MSRAARRLLGHRCTEPPMLCMTMSHIMRHEPLPRARPRGLSRRRGRRSRRRTYSQRTRGRREVAERRLRRHRQGGVRELGRCAAALHRRLGGVRQRLALAGRHRYVRAHLARGLRLAAGAPANVQLVVAREQHLLSRSSRVVISGGLASSRISSRPRAVSGHLHRPRV